VPHTEPIPEPIQPNSLAELVMIADNAMDEVTMSYDPNNILKRIVSKELPCHLVFEDEHTIAIMDIMPESKGHCLIVPKVANTDLTTSDEDTAVRAIKLVRKIASAAIDAFGADGVVVKQFNRAPAGQTIFHLHFHVVPVYQHQPLKAHERHRANDADLAAEAVLLKTALSKFL